MGEDCLSRNRETESSASGFVSHIGIPDMLYVRGSDSFSGIAHLDTNRIPSIHLVARRADSDVTRSIACVDSIHYHVGDCTGERIVMADDARQIFFRVYGNIDAGPRR
jgi:hypothetical protein